MQNMLYNIVDKFYFKRGDNMTPEYFCKKSRTSTSVMKGDFVFFEILKGGLNYSFSRPHSNCKRCPSLVRLLFDRGDDKEFIGTKASGRDLSAHITQGIANAINCKWRRVDPQKEFSMNDATNCVAYQFI